MYYTAQEQAEFCEAKATEMVIPSCKRLWLDKVAYWRGVQAENEPQPQPMTNEERRARRKERK
jgi:hypothetical protein